MLKLSIDQIIGKINQELTFEATDLDNSFIIKIEEYVPYICAAIHNGQNFRRELEHKVALSHLERHFEEDPHTADFVSSLPILIEGCDSRYEYDLNRNPKDAIYETAWGKQVWKEPLTEEEKNESLSKYHNFYQIVDALVGKIEKKFKACVIYDIHSYNYKRIERETPVFNIGAEKVDLRKFGPFVEHWRKELSKIKLPDDIENTAEINDVFYGRGYFLEHITTKFSNTLVLATEVKKIYMDEETGESFPVVVNALSKGFKKAILGNAISFVKKMTNLKVANRHKLLSSELDPAILKVDDAVFKLAKNFEILSFVNPINTEQEKKQFFASRFKVNPKFRYSLLSIKPFELKRELYRIPVERINDLSIRNMYVDVINSYADKIDLLACLGTEKFLYNSLRYFGSPSDEDNQNANFMLHTPDMADDDDLENIPADKAFHIFKDSAGHYGFKFGIEISTHITSKALVNNSRKTLILKKGSLFSKRGLDALVHHEIGVHMVTTVNARKHPINLFRLGLPLNTLTQEGLAILAEYFSGNMSTMRLKELALRVVAVNMILRGYEFKETFAHLVEEYKMETEKAYYLTTRIYRGGGFTKDYLYLRGFRDILHYYQNNKLLDNLLIGKTSLEYIDLINEMVDRELIKPPQFKTLAFEDPQTTNPILNYLINGLK